jgi:putative endonuclease
MDTHRLGRRFEELAAVWLEERGWRVLERNVRFQRREIDLIARRGPVVAFVEVKGRRGTGYGPPQQAVTAHKRREIESVARWWIARHGASGLSYRFDVVAVAPKPEGGASIEHLEDAWRP